MEFVHRCVVLVAAVILLAASVDCQSEIAQFSPEDNGSGSASNFRQESNGNGFQSQSEGEASPSNANSNGGEAPKTFSKFDTFRENRPPVTSNDDNSGENGANSMANDGGNGGSTGNSAAENSIPSLKGEGESASDDDSGSADGFSADVEQGDGSIDGESGDVFTQSNAESNEGGDFFPFVRVEGVGTDSNENGEIDTQSSTDDEDFGGVEETSNTPASAVKSEPQSSQQDNGEESSNGQSPPSTNEANDQEKFQSDNGEPSGGQESQEVKSESSSEENGDDTQNDGGNGGRGFVRFEPWASTTNSGGEEPFSGKASGGVENEGLGSLSEGDGGSPINFGSGFEVNDGGQSGKIESERSTSNVSESGEGESEKSAPFPQFEKDKSGAVDGSTSGQSSDTNEGGEESINAVSSPSDNSRGEFVEFEPQSSEGNAEEVVEDVEHSSSGTEHIGERESKKEIDTDEIDSVEESGKGKQEENTVEVSDEIEVPPPPIENPDKDEKSTETKPEVSENDGNVSEEPAGFSTESPESSSDGFSDEKKVESKLDGDEKRNEGGEGPQTGSETNDDAGSPKVDTPPNDDFKGLSKATEEEREEKPIKAESPETNQDENSGNENPNAQQKKQTSQNGESVSNLEEAVLDTDSKNENVEVPKKEGNSSLPLPPVKKEEKDEPEIEPLSVIVHGVNNVTVIEPPGTPTKAEIKTYAEPPPGPVDLKAGGSCGPSRWSKNHYAHARHGVLNDGSKDITATNMQCCRLCQSNPACRSWTRVKKDQPLKKKGECWLFNHVPRRSHAEWADSGISPEHEAQGKIVCDISTFDFKAHYPSKRGIINEGHRTFAATDHDCCMKCRLRSNCRSWTRITNSTDTNKLGECWMRDWVPEKEECDHCTSGITPA